MSSNAINSLCVWNSISVDMQEQWGPSSLLQSIYRDDSMSKVEPSICSSSAMTHEVGTKVC